MRRQPFSVILLDEFEKAHFNAWDLFLQVFDDGRLTDATGRVADFRHCIICLTSNLGSNAHQSSGLGFAPKPDHFSPDQILASVSKTFRPEFINRLDKVIVFRPLTRDLMRDILKKELNRVLERRGLKNREWAVEWEVSAQEFLLDKGFSREMGARPVRRAIDQYLLAPLAATMVEHRFPEGDQFLFVRSDGNAIQVEFVDPNAESTPSQAPARPPDRTTGITLATMVLQPAGAIAERDALDAAIASIEQQLESKAWEDLHDRLGREMSASGFWQRRDRKGILARFALMDRVRQAARTIGSLRDRLGKSSGKLGQYSRELVSRLALQVHLVQHGINDVMEDAPVEVALTVVPVLEGAQDASAARRWCAQLSKMYQAWAVKRRMQSSELSDSPADGSPILVFSGFGAHRVLAAETGLHVLESGERRAVARVRVTKTPLDDLPRTEAFRMLWGKLSEEPPSGTVVRRYRGEPSPLVRDAIRGWRTGRMDEVLKGDFDLIGAE